MAVDLDTKQIIEYSLLLITGGVTSTIITGFFNKHKMDADAAEALTKATVTLLQPLDNRINDLQKQLNEAREALAAAQREVDRLHGQVRAQHRK